MLFLGLIMDDSKRKGWSFIYWLWREWTLGIRLKNCLLQGIVIEYSNCERLKNGKPCLTWTLAKIACLSLREIFNLHTKRNDDSSRKGTPAKGITLIISGAIPQAGVIDTSLNETWAVSTYKKRKVNKTTSTVRMVGLDKVKTFSGVFIQCDGCTGSKWHERKLSGDG